MSVAAPEITPENTGTLATANVLLRTTDAPFVTTLPPPTKPPVMLTLLPELPLTLTDVPRLIPEVVLLGLDAVPVKLILPTVSVILVAPVTRVIPELVPPLTVPTIVTSPAVALIVPPALI